MKLSISKFNNLRNTQYIILTIVGFVFLLSSCEKDLVKKPAILSKIKAYESIELDAKQIFNQIEEQAINESITINLSHINPNWVFSMQQNEDTKTSNLKGIERKNGVEQIVELEKAFFLYGSDKIERPSLIVSRASGFYLEFLDNERLQIVEALADYNSDAKDNEYILYTSEDLIIEDKHLYGCKDSHTPARPKKTVEADGSIKMVHANRFVDVRCVADLGFRSKMGGSTATFNEMYDILFLGGARFWFYSDYNLRPMMKGIYIDYTPIIPANATASEGLEAFKNSEPITNSDAAVLFTDRLLFEPGYPGPLLGAAYKGVMCSKKYKSHAYNAHWPHDFVRHQNFAHELAHLFNAEHHSTGGPMEANILDATSVNFYWRAENEMDIYLEDDANEACILN